MYLTVSRFRAPKRGSTEREYEDATARNGTNRTPRRFAVADGASESSFARLWARLLAGAYVRGELGWNTLVRDLAPLQQRWQADISGRSLPWHAALKAQRGAFAALAGLTLNPDGGWSALATGDCCLFHVREGCLRLAFPIADVAEFDNRPILISSNPARNGALEEASRLVCGAWQRGDRFLLMSDALAAYFLGRVRGHGLPAGCRLDFEPSAAGFRCWVDGLRATRAMRNDDVSLIDVQVM